MGSEEAETQPANCVSRSERCGQERRPLAAETQNCEPRRQSPPERVWPTRPLCIEESTVLGDDRSIALVSISD